MSQTASPRSRLPDIVVATELESDVCAGYTIHYVYEPHPNSANKRPLKTEQRWDRERELGSGGFGTVWLEKCTRGPKQGGLRAVKEIRCRTPAGTTPSSECARELEAISMFSQGPYRHCFVQSQGWYETVNTVYVAMEFMEYGDLQDFIFKGHRFAGEDTIAIIKQILEGIAFMHDRNFTHRDLKPRNILIQTPGPNWWVKIADFGITKRVHEATGLTSVVGTPAYMAPEVQGIYPLADANLDHRSAGYTSAVDIWAIGAMAFHIMTGQAIFSAPQDLFQYVVMGTPLRFPKDIGQTNQFEDFIGNLMAPPARLRPSARQAVHHPWIQLLQDRPPAGENTLQATASSTKGSWDDLPRLDLPTEIRADLDREPSAEWTGTASLDQLAILPPAEPKPSPTSTLNAAHQLVYKRSSVAEKLDLRFGRVMFTKTGKFLVLAATRFGVTGPSNPDKGWSAAVELRDATRVARVPGKTAVWSVSEPFHWHMECLHGSDTGYVFAVQLTHDQTTTVVREDDLTDPTGDSKATYTRTKKVIAISPQAHVLVRNKLDGTMHIERVARQNTYSNVETTLQPPKNNLRPRGLDRHSLGRQNWGNQACAQGRILLRFLRRSRHFLECQSTGCHLGHRARFHPCLASL
ncbi:kinase-like domain-containing protein [Immersiella caudata]|uniref:Kinase-like domain-containing protein n=1 Tax=Immersiella caudata TaxID=314043 RepID=A0AA39WCX2_9PEZI|nr:kinase-like domain-containing protein [Immersiella caudata]